MNLPISITSKRKQGQGLGAEINFPTINCHVDEDIEAGMYASSIFSEFDWDKSKAISCVSKLKDGQTRIETHILGRVREEFNAGDAITLFLHYKLRGYKRITSKNMQKVIEQDKEAGKTFFAAPPKCESCKFFMMEDYGYSNWTVEGTNYSCLKSCFAQTEDRDIIFAQKDCAKHSEGDPWSIDVDHENELPTKAWLEENDCSYEA